MIPRVKHLGVVILTVAGDAAAGKLQAFLPGQPPAFADAVIIAVRHQAYLELEPDAVVKMIGRPAAISRQGVGAHYKQVGKRRH